MVMAEIDPWGTSEIKDYTGLFDQFGISRFVDIVNQIEEPHRYMRRGIIVGHRGYDYVLRAMNERSAFAVMSGFMPSGRIHLGGKMVMDEIIWHQRAGADAFVCIADMESHAVRGIPLRDCREMGVNEYIVSLVASGFDVEKGHIYFQSEHKKLQDLAFELGTTVNFSELSAIYGFRGNVEIAHIISVLVQNADILHPQLRDYGGPKPTVIPVGVDQDPHIRLTRDIASRMRMFSIEKRFQRDQKQNPYYISIRAKKADSMALEEIATRIETEGKMEKKVHELHIDLFEIGESEIDRTIQVIEEIVREMEIEYGGYGFLLPAAIYHRFVQGLTGGKMSSSVPESYIALIEPPEVAAKKVMRAKTGGQATVEEQKKFGGSPEECVIYDLLVTHLIEEDNNVKEIYEECKSGKRLCKTCKTETAELIFSFIEAHQREREIAIEVLKKDSDYRRWFR